MNRAKFCNALTEFTMISRKRSRSNDTEVGSNNQQEVILNQAATAVTTSSTTTSTTQLAAPQSIPTNGSEESAFAAFERQHVHEVYDSIAAHFASTRYKPWPLVRQFVESLPKASFLADVGCGNGKNLPRSEVKSTSAASSSLSSETNTSATSSFSQTLSTSSCIGIGCDYSAELLRFPATSGLEVLRGDGLQVPFRDNAFDAAMSIAVIHHFSTPDRRMAAIRELVRIVRPGGKILIYVWAREQPKRRCPEGGTGDVMVPWEMHKKYDDKETVHARYYHFFEEGELEGLVEQLNKEQSVPVNKKQTNSARKTVTLVKSYYDKENWCIILQPQE